MTHGLPLAVLVLLPVCGAEAATRYVAKGSGGKHLVRGCESDSSDGVTHAATRDQLCSKATDKLGIATSDPLGQARGVCSIAAIGQRIDCSLDINRTARGTNGDAGADQCVPPPTAASHEERKP